MVIVGSSLRPMSSLSWSSYIEENETCFLILLRKPKPSYYGDVYF